MFLLFALSITPKELLHDVITGHKHSYIKISDHENLRASKNNFQCNWNHQIVESPFVDEPGFLLQAPSIVYTSSINHFSQGYNSANFLFSSLRGPPCQIW